jgi:uncharacterized membrane protein YfcA
VKILGKQRIEKEACGYNFHSSDLEFSTKNATKLAALAFFGGICGGCLGIGGGMIFNPLLLELGMLPTVSSATGMYLVMFSSLSTVTQFVIMGHFFWYYAIWLGAFSIIGTIFGIIVVNRVVKRTGKQSIVVLLLVTLIYASLVAMPAEGIYNIVKELDDGKSIFAFKNPCVESN